MQIERTSDKPITPHDNQILIKRLDFDRVRPGSAVTIHVSDGNGAPFVPGKILPIQTSASIASQKPIWLSFV